MFTFMKFLVCSKLNRKKTSVNWGRKWRRNVAFNRNDDTSRYKLQQLQLPEKNSLIVTE